MDNNNTIPYGTFTWQNDSTARERHQRVERQERTQRPPAPTDNGATFSFARPSRSVNPQTPHNSVFTGAFDGLRNSSRRINQQSSVNNFATLQQPAVISSGRSSGNPTPSISNVSPQGNVSLVYNSPAVSQTVDYTLNPRSSNLFSRNVSGFQSASSMDIPGQSRQYSRMRTEGMGSSQAGATRSKRKITDYDTDSTGSSSRKQLLTEKMAAEMYNLSISNDFRYSRISSPRPEQLDSKNQRGGAASTDSLHSLSNMEDEQEEDKDKGNRNDIPTFVLASGVKEALKKNDSILPDAIVRQVNRPCLAVIPWQPINSLALVNISSDKKEEINKDFQESYRTVTCVDEDIVVDQDPVVNPKRTPPCTYNTFSLDDDDDMDL